MANEPDRYLIAIIHEYDKPLVFSPNWRRTEIVGYLEISQEQFEYMCIALRSHK